MHLSSSHDGHTTTHTASSHHDHSNHRGRNHPGGDDDINSKFMHALAHGFYDVGIVLVVWYTGMCALGGACRVYLCVEECWNRRSYRVLPLNRVEGEEEEVVGGGDGDDASLGDIGMRNLREVRDED